MDANTRKNKRPIARRPERMILIGIYHDDENGILIVRKDDETMQLPGGKLWRYANHALANNQLTKENRKISKIVFEKCGMALCRESEAFYCTIEDPITGKSQLFKVLVLKPDTLPIERSWQRFPEYEGEFIPADLDQIQKYYPNLSYSDMHILIEYFYWLDQNQNADDAKVTTPKPTSVISI